MKNRRLKKHGTTSPVLASGAVLVLALGACAGGEDGGDPSDSVATVTETPTRTVDVTAPPETSVPPETVPDQPETVPEQPEVPGEDPGVVSVPGEETETYFSTEGQEVGLAGVSPDMVPVVVREQPAVDSTPVAELDKIGAVVLAGREWRDPALAEQGYWAEVRVDGVQGWIPSGNLYHFGGNADVTADYAGIPASDGPQGVVAAVAEQATRGMGDWLLETTPDYAGEPFYRVDVTGMQDDAQAGERLFVTVREDAGENGREYTVDTVERTLLCHRGVSGGLCL